ncbi:MAG: lipopolysaccharide transport periplasmic protein LptA [Desulfobacteraceae bacterium]|jgi:lipopolysaccharide export system protein LptA|nr:lipopolysaccharide transport periplasmic protein LptA [Desulfobacteraceae bacterium]
MKTFNCKTDYRLLHQALALAVMMLLAVPLCLAQDASSGSEGESGGGERIHVVADRLITNTEAQTAEFIGNVRATQGDTVIVGDRLKVYYENAKGKKNATGENAAITKLVVTGNVTINLDDKVAVSEQAVYLTESGILVLSGANSKITSENNSVSGDKITLYREEDRMEVEGSSKERVEAIFYPKEKGLN